MAKKIEKYPKHLIVFDVETNGFSKDTSVLSISAFRMKIDRDGNFTKEDTYNRFYHLLNGDEENKKAVAVHGLTFERVEELRGSICSYPTYYKDDLDDFREFCKGANHYIGHNVEKFDSKFIPWELPKIFDTMTSNIDRVCIPNSYGNKWPKLNETANFYNIKLDEKRLHESLYDVEITAKIFYRMWQKQFDDIRRFLY